VSSETPSTDVQALQDAFGALTTASGAPGQLLLRFNAVRLPTGCNPRTIPVLLVLQNGQRPQVFVKGGIKLPNGAVPRNYTCGQVGGEEWWSFSFSFPWDEKDHTHVQFVGASLQRFAKTE
jgi:hypothetical protein